MPPPPIGRDVRVVKNQFQQDIDAKKVGDGVVTPQEAAELTTGWNKPMTQAQADSLKNTVQNNISAFQPAAAKITRNFINNVVPRLIMTTPPGIPATSAKLTWDAPTMNTNGQPLTDLAGYKVMYGQDPNNLNLSLRITDPRATTVQIDNLGSGTWYFAMKSVNTAGQESAPTGNVSKVVP